MQSFIKCHDKNCLNLVTNISGDTDNFWVEWLTDSVSHVGDMGHSLSVTDLVTEPVRPTTDFCQCQPNHKPVHAWPLLSSSSPAVDSPLLDEGWLCQSCLSSADVIHFFPMCLAMLSAHLIFGLPGCRFVVGFHLVNSRAQWFLILVICPAHCPFFFRIILNRSGSFAIHC